MRSAAEWFGNASLDATPALESLCPPDMELLSNAPPIERAKPKYQLRSLSDDEEEDVTEQLFVKMNRLTGAKSKEDKALEQKEGVDDAEWDEYDDEMEASMFGGGGY